MHRVITQSTRTIYLDKGERVQLSATIEQMSKQSIKSNGTYDYTQHRRKPHSTLHTGLTHMNTFVSQNTELKL